MKKILLAFSVIAMMLLVGCTQGNQEVSGSENPFQGGTQGVISNFEDMGVVEGASEEVFQDETFPLAVRVQNKGEDQINPGNLRIILRGVPLDSFDQLKPTPLGGSLFVENRESLEGISEFNPDGTEEVISFVLGDGDTQYTAELGALSHVDLDFFVDVIYDYKTDVNVPKVCFKEDLREQGICEVNEAKDVFSSAGPLQVTAVNEVPAGTGKVALEFTVVNTGNGKVQARVPGQNDEDFHPTRDFVGFRITSQGQDQGTNFWDCTAPGPENVLRLEGGQGTIRCKLTTALDEGTLYTQAVNMELLYQYKETISKTLRVKNQDQ